MFGKEHRNVTRKIDSLEISNNFRLLNFELDEYIDGNGDYQRLYNMTRDGWTILVMGFTGRKAMQFKEAYIARFNEMENRLKSIQIN